MAARKIAVVPGGHSYEVHPFHALFRALPGIDGARIFCYQSGHDHQACEDANFQTVLAQGIHWAARR
jgi:hypothetical protein